MFGLFAKMAIAGVLCKVFPQRKKKLTVEDMWYVGNLGLYIHNKTTLRGHYERMRVNKAFNSLTTEQQTALKKEYFDKYGC